MRPNDSCGSPAAGTSEARGRGRVHASWAAFDRSHLCRRSSFAKEKLGATKYGDHLAGLLVPHCCIPYLRRAAAMDQLGFARNAALAYRPDEVRFQLNCGVAART